jgi:type IV secretory pathway VirB10-like protein
MHPHLRAPCTALLCATALNVTPGTYAQDIHKCTIDGKISYSDRPCPAASTAASILNAPVAPPPDPRAATSLARARKEAQALEKARLARDDKEERASAKAAQAARVQRRKCDKLRLNRQWADDDVRRATAATIDRARIKAQRAADTFAVECGR